jgi:hypothetical protein
MFTRKLTVALREEVGYVAIPPPETTSEPYPELGISPLPIRGFANRVSYCRLGHRATQPSYPVSCSIQLGGAYARSGKWRM